MLTRRGLFALAPGALLAACAQPSGTALERARAAGVLRIGISGERPYSYTDTDGRITGAQPEVARAVLGAIGVEGISAVQLPFDQLLPRLQDGLFDLVAAGLTISPERCGTVAFSRPDFLAPPAFVVRTGNPHEIDSFRDVARTGIRLAVLAGSTESVYARAAGVREENIELVTSQSTMLDAVAGRKADAGALTHISLVDELRRNPGSGLEVTKPTTPRIGGRDVVPASGFVMRQADTDLRAAFDEALAALHRNGDWLRITGPFGMTADNVPPDDLTTEELCRPST